mmetsp:Transcript_10895/g.19411  ORF Transcript_10895/g.19411 Transcript_10895/m.19411 type:complete len:328 (+) Transcript_10895:46-1029(+)
MSANGGDEPSQPFTVKIAVTWPEGFQLKDSLDTTYSVLLADAAMQEKMLQILGNMMKQVVMILPGGVEMRNAMHIVERLKALRVISRAGTELGCKNVGELVSNMQQHAAEVKARPPVVPRLHTSPSSQKHQADTPPRLDRNAFISQPAGSSHRPSEVDDGTQSDPLGQWRVVRRSRRAKSEPAEELLNAIAAEKEADAQEADAKGQKASFRKIRGQKLHSEAFRTGSTLSHSHISMPSLESLPSIAEMNENSASEGRTPSENDGIIKAFEQFDLAQVSEDSLERQASFHAHAEWTNISDFEFRDAEDEAINLPVLAGTILPTPSRRR